MIPKQIVQTHRFDKENIPPYVLCPMETWQEWNPDFKYLYFGQKDRDEFMSSFQIKDIADIYFYPKTIQISQADIFRACFIYDQGGVYVDSDLICLDKIFNHVNENSKLSLETADHNFYIEFKECKTSFVVNTNSPFLQNHFFAAEKNHKYFETLFEVVLKNSSPAMRGDSSYGQREVGINEVGPPSWCEALLLFGQMHQNEHGLEIDIEPAAHNGLFIDIGGTTTWNDGPLTNSRLKQLPNIFSQMARGGELASANANKNVGSFKFHRNDGHGNGEYVGFYGI